MFLANHSIGSDSTVRDIYTILDQNNNTNQDGNPLTKPIDRLIRLLRKPGEKGEIQELHPLWICIGPLLPFSSSRWLLIGTYAGLVGMNDGFVLGLVIGASAMGWTITGQLLCNVRPA